MHLRYGLSFINKKAALIQKILDIRINYTYIGYMPTQEILKLLYNDGWFEYEQNGSHIQLKHNVKKGMVTVPNHKGDLEKHSS